MVDFTPPALELIGVIWGPIAQAGKAQLAEFREDDLALLRDFVRRGGKLQETHAGGFARWRVQSHRGQTRSTVKAESRQVTIRSWCWADHVGSPMATRNGGISAHGDAPARRAPD